ncbi:GTP 3',8-cyclase 2 [bioreactor metagenome]|uniref:GTP 3',8-cyclase 2 n=1 Tax=bioreactor metagenome TaxID=1076179 RepID=A0A645GGS9_9ZZZZ
MATLYRLPGARGCVGLISPMSRCFCADCNRIRVTADGKLKGCLHSNEEIDLKNKTDDELKILIAQGISQKPAHHRLHERPGESRRSMNQIGG